METNRRQYPRQSNKIPIQVLFASDSPRDDLDRNSGMSAKICNQSHNGLYIETDRALESGSTIRVKMIPPENAPSANACYIHDCQVVWREKFPDRRPQFGIGVRILRRNVQADVLSSRFG